MESSIAEFLLRLIAFEHLPIFHDLCRKCGAGELPLKASTTTKGFDHSTKERQLFF